MPLLLGTDQFTVEGEGHCRSFIVVIAAYCMQLIVAHCWSLQLVVVGRCRSF